MLGNWLSQVASRIKGSDYRIDERIPDSYLAGVGIERLAMRARGIAMFPGRSARPYVGRRVRIRCRSRLTVGTGTTFGHGSYVDALAERGVRFGRNVSVGRNTRIECTGNLRTLGVGLTVGDDVGLGTDCFYGCAGGIEIGADTIVGNLVTMHAENHRYAEGEIPIRLQGVTHAGVRIGANCWIGAKATILDGAIIEDGCVVAAGSVVVAGTYAANGIYGGIPARQLGTR